MKNLCSLLFLLFSTVAFFSCNEKTGDPVVNPGSPNGPAAGTPTEFGKPVGTPVSKKIGPEGGDITTPDGKLTLAFPAGAVKFAKTITIQPVENKAWNGVGTGYEFGPDGSQFDQPVTFTYHYNDLDVSGASLDFLGLAFQKRDGVWQLAQPVKVDKVQKTIIGRINHFSWWSLVTQYELTPEIDGVVTKQTKEFTLKKLTHNGTFPFWEGKTPPSTWEVDQLITLSVSKTADRSDIKKVYLNGEDWTTTIPKNQIYGAVGNAVNASEAILVYTAPPKKPENDTVAIAVELRHAGGAQLMLISRVVIRDGTAMTVDGIPVDDIVVQAGASSQGFALSAYDATSTIDKPLSVHINTPTLKVGSFAFDLAGTYAGAVNGRAEKQGSSMYKHCSDPKTESGKLVIESVKKEGLNTVVKGYVTGKVVVNHWDDENCNHVKHETMNISLNFDTVVSIY